MRKKLGGRSLLSVEWTEEEWETLFFTKIRKEHLRIYLCLKDSNKEQILIWLYLRSG